MIAWQSAHNLFSRHEAPSWFTLPILLLVIVTKEVLSRYALRKSEETSSAALKGDAWHHRSDAITSAAAFLGIVVALIGGPDYAKADDVAAFVGCAVIGYNGGKLLKQALHENMDGAPEREVVEGVRAVAAGVAGVLMVEKIRMKKIGLGYFVELHLHVYRGLNVEEGHRIAHAAKVAIGEAFPHIRDIATHVEPYGATAQAA